MIQERFGNFEKYIFVRWNVLKVTGRDGTYPKLKHVLGNSIRKETKLVLFISSTHMWGKDPPRIKRNFD
jgi:hypothetical protein